MDTDKKLDQLLKEVKELKKEKKKINSIVWKQYFIFFSIFMLTISFLERGFIAFYIFIIFIILSILGIIKVLRLFSDSAQESQPSTISTITTKKTDKIEQIEKEISEPRVSKTTTVATKVSHKKEEAGSKNLAKDKHSSKGVSSKPKEKTQDSNIENFLGGHILNKIGMIILILGVGFFLQHSFVNGWITPPFQILIGLLVGAGLLFLGESFNKKGYSLYSRAFTGGGSLILYISFFAANAFYDVIPDYYISLILCLIVTAITLTLAFKYKSTVIVYFGLIGVYLSPFILNYNGEISKLFLLIYFTLMNLALFIYNKFLQNQAVFYGYIIGGYLMPIIFGMELDLIIFFFIYYTLVNITLAILAYENDWSFSMFLLLFGGFILPSISLAFSNIGNTGLYLFYAFTVSLIYFSIYYLKDWSFMSLLPVGVIMFFAPLIFFNKYTTFGAYLFVGSIFLISAFLIHLKANKYFFGFVTAFAVIIPRIINPASFSDFNDVILCNFYTIATVMVLLFISRIKDWNFGLLLTTIFAYPMLIITTKLLNLSIYFLIIFYLIFLIFGFLFLNKKITATEVLAVIFNALFFISYMFYLIVSTDYLSDYKGLFIGLMALIYFGIGMFYTKKRKEQAQEDKHNSLKKVILSFFALSLALLIIVIPIQLDGTFITLAWASLGFFLFWLSFRINELKLRITGLVLYFISMFKFFMIDFGSRVLDTNTAFFSVRSLTFILFIAFTVGLVYLFYINCQKSDANKRLSTMFYISCALALLLIFAYINYEILMLFTDIGALMMMTLCWAIYATVLIYSGFKYEIRWLRIVGLCLFVITILKLFFLDIWQLEKVFRIAAFVGLGIILLLVSFLYNKFKLLFINK